MELSTVVEIIERLMGSIIKANRLIITPLNSLSKKKMPSVSPRVNITGMSTAAISTEARRVRSMSRFKFSLRPA